jgi:predicted AAA+ superfamily ATPase
MFERIQLNTLKKRISEKRKFIQTVVGPRQVGKTTMVKQVLESVKTPHLFLSTDGVGSSNTVWIKQQWETARIQLKISEAKEFLLVIDEIQKISQWSEFVKEEWDFDTNNSINIKVILLGSSRLLIQKGPGESLAGRFETIYLGHWTFSEMENAFGYTADEFTYFGGYPGSAGLISNEKRWKDYIKNSLIESTISQDILMMTRVDKPALLKNLFEIGSQYSGQVLSYSKILGQLQDAGNTTTLSHYLELLSISGLLEGLEKYYTEKVRQRSSSPKFQISNTALLSAQVPHSFVEIKKNPEKWGRWVESVVGAHLLNFSKTEDIKLYYWRHVNDEIDFVVVHKEKVIALEIKSGNTQKASGMIAFQKQFKPNKILLIGNSGLPWQEFIKINPIELF